jgi:3-oxoacyl-[acyl-carrier protein] reductase
MMKQGSGVILPLSVPMARVPAASSGSFGMAGAAVEGFSRQLAAELGPYGVRVVCLRPTGIPETATRLGAHTRQIWGRAAGCLGVTLEHMTATVANITLGAVVD